MNQLDKDLAIAQTVILMTSYSFDLQGYALDRLLSKWLTNYHSAWIRLATIEALYLGRYKAISIEQIMAGWSRLGSPKVHFGGEFERLICRKLPRHLVADKDSGTVSQPKIESHTSADSLRISEPKHQTNTRSQVSNSENLDRQPHSPTQNHSSSDDRSQTKFSPSSMEDLVADREESIATPSHQKTPQTESSNNIEGFTPIPDMSSLFQKLKAIANSD